MPGDLFIVVDYAERARAEVTALLNLSLMLEAAARAGKSRKIRVVMLARGLSEVWDALAREHTEIGEFMAPGGLEHVPLDPLAEQVEDRNKEFDRAYAAFAGYFAAEPAETARPIDSLPAEARPDLAALADRDDYCEAVMIHLAALAMRRDAMAPGEVTADGLLDWVIGRERAELDRRARLVDDGGNLAGAPMLQAAGIVTLAALGDRALSLGRTAALLQFCPLMAEQTPALRHKVAEILAALYPGPDGILGLAPDRIGITLLSQLPPEFFAAVLPRLDAGEATNALTKLNWLARDRPEDGAPRLAAAFAEAPERLLPLVIAVAQASGDPIGKIAAEWLDNNPRPGLAETIVAAAPLPYPTTALREFAVSVETQLLAVVPEDGSEESLSRRAQVANNLSVRLADLGRREDALDAIQEAVAIRRDLAEARPEAYNPDLAGSLNNLSNRLADLGRPEAALTAIQDALAIQRNLAEARPEAFNPDLAGSLNSLSNQLAGLGRPEAALTAIQDAVAIDRKLAEARPEAFNPDLAGSLNNLSNRLTDLERPKAALEVNQEAVAIRRALAAARPEAFNPDFAMSLNNIATDLAAMGRPDDALEAIQEAVAIRRALAAERPVVFNTALGRSLRTMADVLAALGREDDARAAGDEADRLGDGG